MDKNDKFKSKHFLRMYRVNIYNVYIKSCFLEKFSIKIFDICPRRDVDSYVAIEEFPDYLINAMGEVLCVRTNRLITQRINHQQIRNVTLHKDGRQHCRSVAVLVAKHFVDNDVNRADTVIHVDGNRLNVSASNLMWRSRPFAIAYHQQFGVPFRHRINEPLRIQETGEVFPNSFELAIAHGLLERGVVLSALNIRGGVSDYTVFPTGFHILYENIY